MINVSEILIVNKSTMRLIMADDNQKRYDNRFVYGITKPRWLIKTSKRGSAKSYFLKCSLLINVLTLRPTRIRIHSSIFIVTYARTVPHVLSSQIREIARRPVIYQHGIQMRDVSLTRTSRSLIDESGLATV